MRGTKVGDAVRIEPMSGKVLHGAVVSIDSQGLRCVATDEGYVYRVPDEMEPSDQPANVKPVEELEPGDVVVLFNGMQRTVEHVVPTGTPQRYRVTFAETDKVLTLFRQQTSLPGDLWRVVPQPSTNEETQ